jgi:dimethylhistidine N-methyltransferase
MDKLFADDIRKGLTNKNKFIPDRQYYDERGSVYFQELMSSPDYYVTNSELEIFEKHKTEICNLLSSQDKEVKIIEFGAGDALKTKILLKEFAKNNKTIYYPIDFSKKYLDDMEKDFSDNMQDVEIKTINKDYFDALELIGKEDNSRKIILFIGSSLGGLTDNEINNFFIKLSELLNKNDILLFGFDLKKSPDILYKAYHNTCKNWCTYLLQRVNVELNADFDLNKFEYYTTYNPENGKFKWYFISKEEQSVLINKLDLKIDFELGEAIYFGQSKKFSLLEIEDIAKKYGFKNKNFYFDNKHYFTDVVMIKE